MFESLTLDPLYTMTNGKVYENFADAAPVEDPLMSFRRGMMFHQFALDYKLYTDLFYGIPQTQESLDYSVDVKNAVATANMQFVTGQKELNDTTWAEYLKNWSSMGGSEILKSYVDAYNNINNTNLVPAM